MKKLFITLLFSISITMLFSQPFAADHVLKAEEFRKNSLPDSAIFYYEKAVEEYSKSGNSKELINSYNQLAAILTRMDKYEKALSFLQNALKTAGADTNSLLTASTYINLGVVYNAQEMYARSLFYHFKSLNIRVAALGEESRDVATSYGNIGNVYLNNKDYDNALSAHLKAMSIREKIYGKDGVEVIQSYTGLGNVYKEKKEYENALLYYEKALKSKILQRGEKHKELIKYYKNMTEVYTLMGNKEQADLFKAKAEELSKS